METYLYFLSKPCFVGPDFALDGCQVCFFSLSPDNFLLSIHYSLACLLRTDEEQRVKGELRLNHFPSW